MVDLFRLQSCNSVVRPKPDLITVCTVVNVSSMGLVMQYNWITWYTLCLTKRKKNKFSNAIFQPKQFYDDLNSKEHFCQMSIIMNKASESCVINPLWNSWSRKWTNFAFLYTDPNEVNFAIWCVESLQSFLPGNRKFWMWA